MNNSNYAARWGGEEFVLLLPGIALEEAKQVAESVRRNIETMIVPTEDGTDTKITVSIGVNSIIPDEKSAIGDFIRKADFALYKAKELGRNKVVANSPNL